MLTFLKKLKLNKSKQIWFLAVILFLGAFLRFYQLDLFPPSLFADETDVGYQAYSLLKTGRDYRGNLFPAYLQSLTEWRAPLLMYSTVPSIAVFGLNEWGVRIPPALFGVLTILLVYLVVKELFQDEKWALLSALLLAINPWHLHYSRAAFEVTLLLFLFLLGVYCFLKGLKNSWFLLGAVLVLGLTLYTYSTAVVFLPLILIALIVLYWSELIKLKNKKLIWLALAIFLIILIPFTKNLFFGEASGRFNLISVFADQGIIEEIHLRRLGGLSFEEMPEQINLVTRLFINRPVYWSLRIANNYLAAFSPEFLFSQGDPQFRHSVNQVGYFYLVEVILIIIGALALFKQKKKAKWFIFLWLILAPLPSALTQDGGHHGTRLFLMIFPLVILSGYGLFQLIEALKKSKKIIIPLFLISILLFFNFLFYLHYYFLYYPQEAWRYWHYGYKQIMEELKTEENNYQEILINNSYEPSTLHYLFWTQYPPERFQERFITDRPTENILPGFNGFNFDNLYFGYSQETNWWDKILTKERLYLASQEKDVGGDWDWRETPPAGVKVLKTVTNPYHQPIFYLVTHE